MQFIVLVTILVAVTQFHRFEHLKFIAELRLLQKKLAAEKPEEAKIKEQLKSEDWRIVKLDGAKLCLRRAFNVPARWDMLRYAVPLVLFCLMIFVLESWRLAVFYAALLAVKWFATVTVLELDALKPGYEVRLLNRRLFGETLAETEKKPDNQAK